MTFLFVLLFWWTGWVSYNRMSKLFFPVQWKWKMTAVGKTKLELILVTKIFFCKWQIFISFFVLFGHHPVLFHEKEQWEHSSERLVLLTKRRKSYGVGTTWWWELSLDSCATSELEPSCHLFILTCAGTLLGRILVIFQFDSHPEVGEYILQ